MAKKSKGGRDKRTLLVDDNIYSDPIFDRTVENYEDEYMSELRFNKFRLDEEYEEQPRKYMKWARLFSRAITLRKLFEMEVDRVKAEVDHAVRGNPEAFGLEPDKHGKVMEGAIRSTVTLDDSVKRTQRFFGRAYELSKLFEQALKAFEHRKELLKGEGQLWLGEYYSDVSQPAKGDVIDRKVAREGGMELDLIDDF